MPQVPSSTLGKVSSNESNPLKADYNLPEVGASPTPTPDPTTNFAPAIDEAFIPPKPVIQMKQNEIPEGEIVPEYNYEDVSVRAARAKEYGKTPEMAARIFNVEDRTGLPTAFIEQNLEDLEKEADQQGFSVSHFTSKNPKLAEWLSKNSNNYALAKDDMDNVKDLEDHESEYTKTQSFHDALYNGLANFNSGLAKTPAMAYELANLPRNIAAFALDAPSLERRAPDWLRNNPVAKYYDEQAKISHDNNPDLMADIVELAAQKKWDKAGRALAAQVVANAPNSIAMLFMGAAKMPMQGLALAATTTASQAASEQANLEAPVAVSTMNAITKGGFEAAFEQMGTLNVLKQWSTALTKSVGKQGTAEIIKNFALMLGSGFIQEGSEEVATGYAQDLTDYVTGINPDALEGINSRRVSEFLVGGVSGSTMTAPAGLAMGYAQNRMKAQSDTMKNTYIAMGKSSEASKVRERLPAKYKEYVDHVTKNGQLENIHMPVEKFTELFQSYEGGLAGAIQDLGIEDSYNTAKESGGMVTVKLSAWTDKVVGTELFQKAADDITFDPNVFTQNEVKEFQKAVLDTSFDVEKFDAEKAVDGLTPMQQIERMLSSTGMDQASARKNAILMRGINQIAKNTGKTPEQLFGEYKLNITKPMAQPNVKNFNRGEVNKPDAYRILKNLRSGKKITDAKVGGQSLHQFIRKMGGIKNDEFAAEVRDLQKGKKGSGLTRSNAKLSLDKMAEAANESGYIKAMDAAELLKAIEDEYLGSPRYSDQKINENLRAEQISQAQFKEYLDSIGVDLKTMTDEEIMDKIDQQNKARATSEVETYLQMAGRKSLTHNAEQLSKAEKMRVDGVDMETIRKETGWFMTPDNRWKYEIDDSKAKIIEVSLAPSKKKSYTLEDILDHDALFLAYPDLRNIKIEFGAFRGRVMGHFSSRQKTIRINLEKVTNPKYTKLSEELRVLRETPEFKAYAEKSNSSFNGMKAYAEFADTEVGKKYDDTVKAMNKIKGGVSLKNLSQSSLGILMHEIQHAIQSIEKTTRGSSGGGKSYWNNAGEVEARDADARKSLTPEERKQVTPAFQTYKNPIIVWGDIEKELPIEEAPVNVLEKIEIGEQMKLFQSKKKDLTKTKEFKNWFQDSKVVDEDGNPLVVYHGGLGATDIEIFDTGYSGQTTGNNTFEAFHFTENADVAQDYSRQSFNRRYQDNPESLVEDGIVKKLPDFKGDYKKQYAYVEKLADKRLGTSDVYLSIQNPIQIDLEGKRVDVAYIERLTNFAKNGVDENGEFEEFYELRYGTPDENGDYNDNPAPIDGIIITNMIDDISPASYKVATQYIVWDNTNIKSVNNKGSFDQNNANILYQSENEVAPNQYLPDPNDMGFHSQLTKEVEKMDFKLIPAKDLASRIKGVSGIKAEELEFTGLLDYLKLAEDQNEKVSKEDVLSFLNENGVKVSQTVLGDMPKSASDIGGDYELEWSDPERDEIDQGDIDSEMEYYMDESNDWYKERYAELRTDRLPDFTDMDDKVDEAGLERAIEDEIRNEAEELATDSLNDDSSPMARFTVTLNVGRDSFTIHGSDEIGWYSPDYNGGRDLGYNLEEAKLKLVGHLIDDGQIEGDATSLVKREDIGWSKPRDATNYSTRSNNDYKEKVDAFYKKDKKRFIKLAEDGAEDYFIGETPSKKDIEARARELAEEAFDERAKDPTLEENNVKISINHPILEGYLQGNTVNGWVIKFKENDKNVVRDIDAKDIEEAQKEALDYFEEIGLVEPAAAPSEAGAPNLGLNKITGEEKFKRYTLLGGSTENYREVLITAPKIGDRKFRYSAHFGEVDNILAHVRISDKVDSEGRKVLFIEELQSDWHQQGREHGYADKELKDKLAALVAEKDKLDEEREVISEELTKELKKVGDLGYDHSSDAKRGIVKTDNWASAFDIEKETKLVELGNKYRESLNRSKELSAELNDLEKAVPNAPFKATDAWAALAMKRMMRMAVDGGYEALAWTPAEVHYTRWGTEEFGWTKVTPDKPMFHVSHDKQNNLFSIIPEGQSHGRPFEGKVYRYGDGVTEESALALANDVAKELNAPHFLVGSVEQSGGFADGVNVEEAARLQGILMEKRAERVTTKEQLHEIIQSTLSRDRSEKSLQRLTDNFWNLMQEKETGSKAPRKEGMQFFYDNLLPKKVMPPILKKLDPTSKVGVTTIDGRETWEVVLSDAIKQKASEGFALFQSKEEVKRGRILFDANGNFNIEFLKDADSTTFLHEIGHFYLEVMRDQVNKGAANQKLQDDYAKILKHIGADGTKPFTVEQHEKFAESWEKYFAEGKAPTRELQSAFDTFKDWMMGVYRSILSMYPKVKLSDDVRGVFDRLLASEEEIERAKHELNASPMILNTDGIMTAEESAKYQRLIEEENQIARDKIRAEAMFSLKASETKKRKARASELKEQITKEVDAEPDQMILKMIKSGVIEGRGDLPAGYDNLKLNRKIAETLYDPKVLRGLPVGVMSPKGVHPDLLAQMFIGGNASGSDLVAMLANIEDRNEKIQRLVDEKMAEEFPDPTIDGTLSDKAIQALHNDASTERRLFEIDQMMKNKPAAVKGLVKKFHARRMTVAQFKNRAELTLGNIAVRDIKPYIYQRAEIRHSKDAMDKFLKGDFEGAIESKQMEIFNHELYKASIIATEEIEKGLISFSKTFQSDEKIAKTRNINYVNAARSILSMHGIGDADKGAEEYLGSVKAYDPDKYNEMMEYVTTATVNAKDHRDLSFNEFVQLKQVIDDLWSFAKLDNQITIDGKKFDRKQAQDEMITVMQGFNAAKKKEYKEFTGSLSESDITNIQFGALASSLKRVEFWCDRMDDGRVDGAFRKFIWNPISDGVIKYRLSKNNYIEKFRDLIKTHTAGFTEREILAPELSGRFALAEGEEGGEKYKFKNKTELLGAYLHVGNLSNKRKLLIGNGWGSLDENKELDSRAWDAFDKRMIAEGIMTKADYDFLQGVWDLMEELKPDAQKAHFELYGYYFSEVTSNEFTNQFGTYRGGYAPAAIDRNRTENTKASQKALEEGTDSSMFPAQVNGFTKKRVESYAVPLSMDLGLVPLHVDAVLRFTHITPRMKDVSRMLYDREFRSELKQFDPHIAEYVLKPWLDRSVKQSVVTPSGNKAADYIFRKLRSNVGMSTMFLNVTNTMQQYTGLFVAATKVSPKHLRNSSYNFIKHSKKMSEFAYEKSAFMKTKITFQLGETTKELQKILNKPTKTEKVSDWFQQNAYALQGIAQNHVDLIVWSASFNEAQEQGISEDQSIRIADSAVRMTQGTFAPEDVSSFETGTPMVRLFTMFTSYFNMLGNLLGSEYIKLVQNNLGIKKNASRAFYVYAVGFMLPAVISGLIVRGMSGKGLDADDDDSYLDDFIALFFGEQLKTATALVPVAGQLANAGYAKFTKEQWDDRISLSPSLSMLEAAVGVPYDIAKAYEDGEINKRGVKDSLTLLSLMSGIPVAPLSKPIGYMMDVQSGNANPKNPVDYSRGLISGKAGN